MPREEEVRIERQGDTARPEIVPDTEPSLGELMKRLTSDTGTLIRQEIALVKAEAREKGRELGGDTAKAGIALGLVQSGTLALVAAVIIGIGSAVGSYGLAALGVGVIALVIGFVLATRAKDSFRRHMTAPETTIETLRDDAAWAKQQAHELKRDLTR